MLCSGRDREGGLCWEEWLQSGLVPLAYYGHLLLPWLPFPPHHSLGRAPKAVTRLELAVAFLSHRGLLMWSVLCQLLGTDTHHSPGGSCGMSWLPTALTFGSFPSPLSHPSQHPSHEGTPIPGKAYGCSWRSSCCFKTAPVSSALPKASSSAPEGGREVLPGAKEHGNICAEAPCASPGHLSRAQEHGGSGGCTVTCGTLNAPGAATKPGSGCHRGRD